MITTIQDVPVSVLLEREYCSEADVELMAQGLGIDFSTVWGGGFTTEDIIQKACLQIERETGRMFFQVRYMETYDGGRTYLVPNHLPLLTVEECYYDDDPLDSILDVLIIDDLRIRRYGMFSPGLQNVSLVYVAGYEDIPEDIRWAVAALVVLEAVNADPTYVAMFNTAWTKGERLTVGPVTMVEGGAGSASASSGSQQQGKLIGLGGLYADTVNAYRLPRLKTTTREDRSQRFYEYVFKSVDMADYKWGPR